METYHSCADGAAKDGGEEWCATLVNEAGEYKSGSGHYSQPCVPCEIPPIAPSKN